MRRFVLVILAVAALVGPTAPAAAKPGLPCDLKQLKAYPGDGAAQALIAQWMATYAVRAGLPAELPVMAALVESGLHDIPAGDADSAGFFQMRLSIWNTGPYAGFADDPQLQLKWFVDQALLVRAQRLAAGLQLDETQYGEWIADVERPPASLRFRYQVRLEEARGLLCPACTLKRVKDYPGDTAAPVEIAGWMANGAVKAGLPPELPVMAALVESGLRNLPPGDSDSAGYFQMRRAVWDAGAYAGFPTKPQLQLQWFVDQALLFRERRLAAGLPIDEAHYGEWIADVERPAESLRFRYQLQLDEARALLCL
jgi:hypothetical protein